MLIQLLFFPGCPHVDSARSVLAEALGEIRDAHQVMEIDMTADDTPEALRAWGSPTILIDGVDVASGAPSGASCRLYAGSEISGVPPLPMVRAALGRWKHRRP